MFVVKKVYGLISFGNDKRKNKERSDAPGTVHWFPHFGPERLGHPEEAGTAAAKYATFLPSWRQICSNNGTYKRVRVRLALASFLNAAKIILRNWKNTSTPGYKDSDASVTDKVHSRPAVLDRAKHSQKKFSTTKRRVKNKWRFHSYINLNMNNIFFA